MNNDTLTDPIDSTPPATEPTAPEGDEQAPAAEATETSSEAKAEEQASE